MDLSRIKPAMTVEPCGACGKVSTDPERYRLGSFSTLEMSVSRMERAIEEAWKKDQETHAANAPALAHNHAIRDAIVAAMKAAGIADERREYKLPSPRSWNKKLVTVRAGYLSDLAHYFPVSDQFDAAQRQHEDLLRRLADHKRRVEEEKAAKIRAQEAEKERRKADLAFVQIIVRYGLPDDSSWEAVLESLRTRNKYLDLAVAMELTRGDWSEGFWRVKAALGRFRIEGDRDKEIAADICGCLAGDESDGRIFRDTTWSYGALYGLVTDAQLLADTKLAMEHCE